MILLAHITIALLSVVYATFLMIKAPRKQNAITVSYVLIALTLISGTYLTVLNPSHLVQSCISGLIYTGVVTAMTSAIRRKMALVRTEA